MAGVNGENGGKGLTPFQSKAVVHYLENGESNASAAVIAAGSKSTNPNVIAAQLFQKPHVQAELARLRLELQKRQEEKGITGDWVVARNRELVEASPVDVLEWDKDGETKLIASSDLTPAARAALKKIKFTRHEKLKDGVVVAAKNTVELDFHSKQPALDAIGRIIGVEHDPNQERPVMVITNVMLLQGTGEE